MTSQLYNDIKQAVQQRGEISGTEAVAVIVGSDRREVIRCLHQLEADGIIEIHRSRGGRGKRTRIVNRNSPGYQRKVK